MATGTHLVRYNALTLQLEAEGTEPFLGHLFASPDGHRIVALDQGDWRPNTGLGIVLEYDLQLNESARYTIVDRTAEEELSANSAVFSPDGTSIYVTTGTGAVGPSGTRFQRGNVLEITRADGSVRVAVPINDYGVGVIFRIP